MRRGATEGIYEACAGIGTAETPSGRSDSAGDYECWCLWEWRPPLAQVVSIAVI